MGVRIDEINIEKAGPISEFQMDLGPFNLIYGRNEQGKTFLVEFLIRSLFKNLSGWSLRQTDSRGKVVVSGLSDKTVSLTPSSRRKLEDRLAESLTGLPTQISRLLVIKGAELNFEDKNGSSVSHAILRAFLSGQGVLDEIQGRISKTVRSARIEGRQPIGNKMGDIKKRDTLISRKSGLDTLFERLEAIFSGGERQDLQAKVAELEAQVDELEAAKRHEAYQRAEQIAKLQEEIDLLPEEEIKELSGDFKSYSDTLGRIVRLKGQLAELTQKSEHYEWLDEAIPLYEQRGNQGKLGGGILFPILIILSLLSAIAASFLDFPLGTSVLIIIAAILGWFYWRQLRTAVDHVLDVGEIKKLEKEFEHRFGRPLSGLPLMQKVMKRTTETYHSARTQGENLKEEQEKLAILHDQIGARLGKLTDETPNSEEWEAVIPALLNRQKVLSKELAEAQVNLAVLGVAEADYREVRAAVDYDPRVLQTLQEELAKAIESLEAMTSELDNLKHRICQETKDDLSAEWTTLIQNLQLKRQEILSDYQDVTAKVLTGILVNQALDTIRAQEDENIRQKLASPLVGSPIQHVTRRYSGVRYDDGRLSLIDDYGEFPIGDLSTGAREQVLLGLRLGFAAHILGEDRHFLLLDDAFQHADWQRRLWLMDQMVGLARDGWQIIYFSMDDHIKLLFDRAGDHHFGDQYKFYDLTTVGN